MSLGYREATDPQGRTTLELRVDRYGLLVAGGFASTFAWMFLEGGWTGSLAAAATAMVFSAAYKKRGPDKVMRVSIDRPARTLTAATEKGERAFKFAEIARAQLNSEMRRKPDGEWHRIDLVLKAGEVVPLMEGFPSDDKEKTLRVIETIDKAIA